MRVQAFAVAAGAVAVAAAGHLPVVVAVGCVAVLAESGVVVEHGRGPGEVQGRAERLGDPAGPAGVDGVAVAVAGSDAFEQQVPLSRLALPLNAVLDGAGPLLPLGGQASGGYELDACGRGPADCARRSHHHRLGHLGVDPSLVFAFPGEGLAVSWIFRVVRGLVAAHRPSLWRR